MEKAPDGVVACKYMTKEILRDFFKKQEEWGYNRQAESEGLEDVISGHADDTKYPVSMALIHEHCRGLLVDPHYRCWLVFGVERSHRVLVDLPIDYYNGLPEAFIPGESAGR